MTVVHQSSLSPFVVILAYLGIYLIVALPWSGIFHKGGQSRLAAFIPIWNCVAFLRIAQRRLTWLLLLVISPVLWGVLLFSTKAQFDTNSFHVTSFPYLVIAFLLLEFFFLLTAVVVVVFMYDFMRQFDRDVFWTMSMFIPLVSIVMAYVLWLGKAQYNPHPKTK